MHYVVLVLLFISLILIKLFYDKQQIKKVLLIIAFDISLLLALLAYYWIPTDEYDLFRYYEWMHNMQNLKGLDLISYLLSRGEYLSMLYFYVISIIDNFALLQFFPVLIGYMIIFYLIIDFSSIKKIKWPITLFCLLLVLSLFKYIFMASVFRASLAFLLFVLMLYLREYKNLNIMKTLLLCLLTILIHNSMILVVGIFLLTFIRNKKIVFIFYLLLFLVLIFAPYVENIVGLIFGNSLFYSLFHKLSLYLSFDFSLTLQSIFRFVQLILLICVNIFAYKSKNNLSNYDRFVIYFIFFIILFIPWYSIWHRFLDLLLFVSIPNIMFYFNKEKTIVQRLFSMALLVMIIGGIIIQIPTIRQMNFVFHL